jgi:hypothetical protein
VTVSDLPSLRRYAEDLTNALPLLRYRRVEALLHAFRVVQAGYSAGRVFWTPPEAYENLREAQDLLRWLTYKVMVQCPPGGRPRPTTAREHAPAYEAIEHFGVIARLSR